MYIFDSHVHIYPEKIASKASDTIGKFYDIVMDFDGTVGMLLKECEKAGITHCLVHSVATTNEQVQKINDYIAENVREHPDKFVGFGSLHPSMSAEETDEEVKRMISIGLKGIKLHPDFQHFAIDDKHAMEMYEAIDGRLPLLFHTGDARYNYSNPHRLAATAKRFPRQMMIGAHFGGYTEVENALKCLPDLENVYVDSSSSLDFISPEKAKECVRAYTEDKIFFGTDYPMWSATDELKRIDRLDLSETAREKIFYKNICKFLNIELG
ncbi:MAG: amidohydrolase family protein [Ruminiclostridium sp.]|nr:amidohydrolase family protein [Ruminiclostridium sp.]